MMQASVVQSPSPEAFPPALDCSSDPDPGAFRFMAAALVAKGQIDEAEELIVQALTGAPDSEDLLVMHVLLCESRQRWADAASALQRLVDIQGEHVTEETLCHWVRVLRCLGDWESAARTVKGALVKFPSSPMLQSESATIESVLTSNPHGKA